MRVRFDAYVLATLQLWSDGDKQSAITFLTKNFILLICRNTRLHSR